MDVLEPLLAQHVSLPITFDVKPETTKMFREMGQAAHELSSHNYTYNNHMYGISPETMTTDKGLADFWTATSHSYSTDTGEAFVATMEAKRYMIFGTQFHPEKVSELWVDGINIDHSWENIQVQEHFSQLLVEKARHNPNTFGSFAETQKVEIST
jgi:gamma-glutamyl hydrolase